MKKNTHEAGQDITASYSMKNEKKKYISPKLYILGNVIKNTWGGGGSSVDGPMSTMMT